MYQSCLKNVNMLHFFNAMYIIAQGFLTKTHHAMLGNIPNYNTNHISKKEGNLSKMKSFATTIKSKWKEPNYKDDSSVPQVESSVDEIALINISNETLRHLFCMAYIFGEIPKVWSESGIMEIFKNKSTSVNPMFYRPVSYLLLLAKVTTCTILQATWILCKQRHSHTTTLCSQIEKKIINLKARNFLHPLTCSVHSKKLTGQIYI